MEGSSYSNVDCDEVSVSVTPSQKQELLKFELLSVNTDLPPNCDGDNSSVASMNEGCESPLSSWDLEPETDIPSLINCDGMPEGSSWVENSDDGLLWEMDNRSYDELLKKFLEKEEELRVSNFRLQLSEQEIVKLNVQVENSEAQLDNVSEVLKLKEEELNKQKELSEEEIFKLKLSEEEIFKLKIQIEKADNRLDNVNKELKLKEEELNKLKELSEEEIFKLKIESVKSENRLDNVREELKLKKEELNKQKELSEEEIFKLKTRVPEYIHEIINIVDQLEVDHENLRMELQSKSSETNLLQGQLKVAQENMVESELELVSERTQNQMLRDLVKTYEANETNQEKEVQKLKSEMLDLQAKFCFDIASLSKQNIELTSKLENCNSRNKELGKKLKQYEAEKLNQLELHATQIVLQDEIVSLRQELKQRMDDAEATNKKLDEANVMINNLKAVICSRDDKISNMKKYTDDVKTSLKELMVDYDTALNEVNNLKLRVGELENEVTRQNDVISDAAEKKKEALRQLHNVYECKVEQYKSGYNNLLKKFYS
ncbi:hypothetical protein TSUD_409490 [Trifolium subterraneum]|uniref:NAB domain-containing protein n=1 Tax=Trifolium subterraneum TaxID=3900 RepID=A0A2Z6PSJ1_TRISU|nr:hypothetical protein TSUD_409490 [Trifolium subterraneum]